MSLTKRSKLILLIGGVVVVILAVLALAVGPTIYRDVIVGPADEAPTAELQDLDRLEPSSLDEGDLAGEWIVAKDSYAGYRVDEVLNGTDVTVTGRTEQVNGTVSASADAITAATITVDIASIATDSGSRDSYFRDQAMRGAEHPTATFELTSPIEAPAGAGVDAPVTVMGTGILTLAGVSNELTVELVAAVSGSTVQVAGQIPVTFADYGVAAPSLGFVQVEETGFVEFLVVLTKA